MGGVYKYDVDDLSRLARGLDNLRSDFEGASEAQGDASGAMGYDSLRGAIEEFVDNWEHNRKRQVEAIGKTATALQEIRDTYVEQDETSAAELRSGGSA